MRRPPRETLLTPPLLTDWLVIVNARTSGARQ
jgi:hypothetical protein